MPGAFMESAWDLHNITSSVIYGVSRGAHYTDKYCPLHTVVANNAPSLGRWHSLACVVHLIKGSHAMPPSALHAAKPFRKKKRNVTAVPRDIHVPHCSAM